jgi:hypothetical protein
MGNRIESRTFYAIPLRPGIVRALRSVLTLRRRKGFPRIREPLAPPRKDFGCNDRRIV